MAFINQSVAVGNATAGSDLLLNSVYRRSDRPRMIRNAVIAGSASVGDTEVQLMIGTVQVARLTNSIAGTNQKISGLDMFPLGSIVPADQEIRAVVTDAPATNPIRLMMNIDDI